MTTRLTTFNVGGATCQIDLRSAIDPLLSDNENLSLPSRILTLWQGAQDQGMPGYPVVIVKTSAANLLYDGTNLWTTLCSQFSQSNPLKEMVKALPTADHVEGYGVFVLPCYRVEHGKLIQRDGNRTIPAYEVTTSDPETLRLLFEEALNSHMGVAQNDLYSHLQPLAHFVNEVKVLTAQQTLLDEHFADLFSELNSEKLGSVKHVWRCSVQERNKKVQYKTMEAMTSVLSIQSAIYEQDYRKDEAERTQSPSTQASDSDLAEEGVGVTSPPLRDSKSTQS